MDDQVHLVKEVVDLEERARRDTSRALGLGTADQGVCHLLQGLWHRVVTREDLGPPRATEIRPRVYWDTTSQAQGQQVLDRHFAASQTTKMIAEQMQEKRRRQRLNIHCV